MQKPKIKLIALILSLLITSSILTSVSAQTFENENLKENLNNSIKKVVTLYKYELNNQVSIIKVEIEINKEEDINNIIEKKCTEILANDINLEKILDNNNTKNTFSLIKSRGRGLHLKLTPTLILPTKNKIFQLLLSENYRKIRIPTIYCRYPKDIHAFTTTTSILTNSSNTTTGPHSVLCIGFYGFKWWIGRISFYGFMLRTGFVGYSTYTKINNL